MITATPRNITVRIDGPSHRGLGFGFFFGGGWYRLRFDLDLGKRSSGRRNL
jgi:hypothetical protein